jgi:hypothetical protein
MHARSLMAWLSFFLPVTGQSFAAEPVNVDNFKRAETHFYMQNRADAGCFAKLCHERAPKPADQQDVVRLNRDTLYSSGVYDLSSPVTVVLPEPKGRFQSLLLINEDHYNPVVAYGPSTITLTQESVGTRYAFLAFRTFMDPNSPKDIAAAHKLQDQIIVRQDVPGTLALTEWDAAQRDELRDMLKAVAKYGGGPEGRFGTPETTTPVKHLIGTAAGWGGNPGEAAVYLSTYPARNDGSVPHVLRLRDIPVDAFWSVTVYNAKGFYEAPESAASVNSVTAKREKDGTAVIHFSGDARAPNYLRIMPGWNYVVRLYRPRQEVIDGSWTLPAAEPVE